MKKVTALHKAVAVAVLLGFSAQAHASWASVLAWIFTMQRQLSAIAVQVKQNAVAANQISDAEVNTRKQLAVAMGALSVSGRVRDVVESYDPTLGQPILSKCDAHSERTFQVLLFAQASKNEKEFVSNFASVSTPSRADADKTMREQHRQLFCSVSEAQQGLCELKPNGMQAWDASYAGPFGQPTMTPDVELAAYAYITNIVDTRPAHGINCKSEACSAARQENMRTTAIGSMIAESLIGQVSMRRSTELE